MKFNSTYKAIMESDEGLTKKVDSVGNVFWYNKKGQYHRLDGPAIERTNGTKSWWVNDERHRLDGPAIEWADGTKEWYVNGKRHRTDGPAIEYVDGRKEWYINDEKLTEEEFNNHPLVKKHKMLQGLSAPTKKAFGNIIGKL